MSIELRYLLAQNPHTASNLARLTGKSVSTIYKQLKAMDDVREGKNEKGAGSVFWIPQGDSEPQGAIEAPQSTQTLDDGHVAVPSVENRAAKTGRKSKFEGKLFEATVKDNPRRKGSHGFRSLQIIIDRPWISYEDFIAAGGRQVDLRWDINSGNVTAGS